MLLNYLVIYYFLGGKQKHRHIFSPISKDKSLQVDIFQLLHSNKTRCHETKEIMHKYLKICTINTVSYNRKQIHITSKVTISIKNLIELDCG